MKAASKDEFPHLNYVNRDRVGHLLRRVAHLEALGSQECNHWVRQELSALKWAVEFIQHAVPADEFIERAAPANRPCSCDSRRPHYHGSPS